MRLCKLIATLVAVVGIPVLADEPSPSIDKLIEQLGHRSFVEREKASKALRERGPAALPALRKAMTSKDEEIRKRIEVLIPPLEIEEALLPKRVTVKANGNAIADVLKDVEKQTGYKLSLLSADQGRKLTFEMKDVAFWDALERIGKEGECVIRCQKDTQNSHQVAEATTDRSSFVCTRGPIRLAATWFHEDRDINLSQPGPTKNGRLEQRLTLSMSVIAEPRITFLKVSPAKVDEAIDEDGKSLLDAVPSAGAAVQPPGRGTFRGESLQWSDIRLKRASETAKTAKLIRGTIPVKAILIRKPVVITNKLMESSGVSFRAGTDSLQITRVQNQGGNNIEVQILIPFDHTKMDWTQHEQWYQRFQVEDDAGNKFQDHGRGSQSNGNQYWISMYYGPPNGKAVGAPTKLVFEDWVVHEYAVPFEFKDVPLP